MRLEKVVGASRYSFEDRETKRLVEGVNVWFEIPAENKDQVGVIPKKVSLPFETWETVAAMTFPCACEVVIDQQFTNRGIKSKPVGIKQLATLQK